MQELKARPTRPPVHSSGQGQQRRSSGSSVRRRTPQKKKGYDVFTVMAFAFFVAAAVTIGFVWLLKNQKASVVSAEAVVQNVSSSSSGQSVDLATAIAQVDEVQRADLLARLEADEIYRKILLSDGMWQSDMLQFWMMFVHQEGKISIVFVNKSLPDLRMYFSGKAEWIPEQGGLVFTPDYPMVAPSALPLVDEDKTRKAIKEITYQPLTKDPIQLNVSFEGYDMVWSVPWQSFKGVPADPDAGFKGVPPHPVFRYISSQSLRWMPLEGQ